MDLTCAPIVLFVYNRPLHTRQTVEALRRNILADQSDLFIYSDGPRYPENRPAVDAVRRYIETIDGFNAVTIVRRDNNMGLSGSVIAGVSEILLHHDRVIVLEDDLVTSVNFLGYMNRALNYFARFANIFSVTAYNYPNRLLPIPSTYPYDVYFNMRAHSWGWGTWKSKWDQADWEVKSFHRFIRAPSQINKFNQGGDDLTFLLLKQMLGKIDSWAIRWCFTHFLAHALSVYPVQSLVDNIGHDGSGMHTAKDRKSRFRNVLDDVGPPQRFPELIELQKDLIENFRSVFKQNLFQRIRQFFYTVWARHKFQGM